MSAPGKQVASQMFSPADSIEILIYRGLSTAAVTPHTNWLSTKSVSFTTPLSRSLRTPNAILFSQGTTIASILDHGRPQSLQGAYRPSTRTRPSISRLRNILTPKPQTPMHPYVKCVGVLTSAGSRGLPPGTHASSPARRGREPTLRRLQSSKRGWGTHIAT